MDGRQTWDALGGTPPIGLAQVGAPLLLCDEAGTVLAATETATELLTLLGLECSALPQRLWERLRALPAGGALQWRPEVADAPLLSLRRHRHTDSEWLVLFDAPREVPAEDAVSAALESKAAAGALAVGIGRELLGPIDRILTAAQQANARLAEIGEDGAQAKVRELQGACREQLGMITDLLDYLERGAPRQGAESLSTCLTRVHRSLASTLGAGNHRVCYQVAPAADLIAAPRVAIEFVLRHLLTNALEAGERGVVIRVAATACGRGDTARVEVRDNGPGIPTPMRDGLFTAVRSSKAGHTGHGLMSARALSRQLGGDLALGPQVRGTRFLWTMPLATHRGKGTP